MTTIPLLQALEPHLDKVFDEIPVALQDVVAEAVFPLRWDELRAGERASVLVRMGQLSDPEGRAEFKRAFDLVLELDEVAALRKQWEGLRVETVKDKNLQDARLNELAVRERGIRRKLLAAEGDDAGAQAALLAQFNAEVALRDGKTRGVTQLLADKYGVSRQAMEKRLHKARGKQSKLVKSKAQPVAQPRLPWLGRE